MLPFVASPAVVSAVTSGRPGVVAFRVRRAGVEVRDRIRAAGAERGEGLMRQLGVMSVDGAIVIQVRARARRVVWMVHARQEVVQVRAGDLPISVELELRRGDQITVCNATTGKRSDYEDEDCETQGHGSSSGETATFSTHESVGSFLPDTQRRGRCRSHRALRSPESALAALLEEGEHRQPRLAELRVAQHVPVLAQVSAYEATTVAHSDRLLAMIERRPEDPDVAATR